MLGLPYGEDCNWLGQLFIMCCYGYILFKAAVLIGDGSEKLLLIYGPGIIGGLLIPVLGAIPDGAIVLVSGLGSDAQCQVSTGVGTLAGSTIMLLTIPWAGSLFLGARDRGEDGTAASKPNGRPKYEDGFQLFSSCVTTYDNTVMGAKLMMLTSLTYLIVLIPAIIYMSASSNEQKRMEHYPALAGLIVCSLAFIGYSIFQLVDSSAGTLQEMEQTRLKFLAWQQSVGTRIATTDNAIKMAFKKFDTDGNGTIDRTELQAGFAALGLELNRAQVVKIMDEFQDPDDDDKDTLNESEFNAAIKEWSQKILLGQGNVEATVDALVPPTPQNSDPQSMDFEEKKQEPNASTPLIQEDGTGTGTGTNDTEKTDRERQMEDLWKELNMEVEMDEDEDHFLELTDSQLICHALVELAIGTLLVIIFSDPMVDTIDEFSDTINVSSFYVSFIVTPLASNASEIYSSLLFAKKKTKEGISMGFSALYGAACMNNTFVLGIFCVLVYVQDLEWVFVAETLVILFTIFVVGLNGLRPTVTVWQGIPVILLFPLSILLVAVLETYLDDSDGC